MAGGGVLGKGAGIDHGTMTEVGPTIKGSHLSITRYPQAGGITTRSIVGEIIRGTTDEYLIIKFDGTGGTGKGVGIGRSSKLGMSRVCSPEQDHHTRLGSSNHSAISNNIGKQHRNPMRADQSANRNIGETVEVG